MTKSFTSTDVDLAIQYDMNCFALNYISHQLLIADDKWLMLFETEHHYKLLEVDYVEMFREIYS